MSARSWVHTDEDGKKTTEELSPRQGIFDDAVLRDFGSLEKDVSEGKKLDTPIHKTTIENMQKLVNQLPKLRKAHWISELERIGAIAASAGAAVKPSSESEKVLKESNGGQK